MLNRKAYFWLIILVLIFCACDKPETKSPPKSPAPKVTQPKAPPISTKSKKVLSQEKLTEIISLIAVIEAKLISIREAIQKTDAKIQVHVAEIKAEKRRSGQSSYAEIERNRAIKIRLETIQKAHAHKQILLEAAHTSVLGKTELEGIKEQLDLDIIILETMEDAKFDQLVDRANLIVTKWQPQAKKLPYPPVKGSDRKELKEIYELYIGAEEKKRVQEIEREKATKKRLQYEVDQIKKREKEKKLEEVQAYNAKLAQYKIITPQITRVLSELSGAAFGEPGEHYFTALWSNLDDVFAVITEEMIFAKKTLPDVTVEGPNPYRYIDDVIWSPDSEKIAILSHSDYRKIMYLKIWSFRQKKYVYSKEFGCRSYGDIYGDKLHCEETLKFVGWKDKYIVFAIDFVEAYIVSRAPIYYFDTSINRIYLVKEANSVAIRNNQSLYYSKKGQVWIYNMNSGRSRILFDECPKIGNAESPFKTQCSENYRVVGLVPNGNLLATTSSTWKVSFWDISEKPKKIWSKPVNYYDFIWWQDNKTLISGTRAFLSILKPKSKTTTKAKFTNMLPDPKKHPQIWSPKKPHLFFSFDTEEPLLQQRVKGHKGKIYIKSLKKSQTIAALVCEEKITDNDSITWSTDGNHLLVLTANDYICIWDISELN